MTSTGQYAPDKKLLNAQNTPYYDVREENRIPHQAHTLVSFRRMTNRAEISQSQSSSQADRVAAALIMSSGPNEN